VARCKRGTVRGRAERAGPSVAGGGGACVGLVQPLWIWAKASASESGIEPEPSERCSACVRKVAARAPMRQPARKVPSAIVRPHGAPTEGREFKSPPPEGTAGTKLPLVTLTYDLYRSVQVLIRILKREGFPEGRRARDRGHAPCRCCL